MTLSGLTFTAGSTDYSDKWYASAIYTSDGHGKYANGLTVTNCTLNGNGSYIGLLVNQIESYTVTNCTFDGWTEAINFYGDNVTSGTVKITNNTFTNCSFAIHGYTNGGVYTVTGNEIIGTSSFRSKVVIQDQYGKHNLSVTITDNTLKDAMIGLVNVADLTASSLISDNSIGDDSYVVIAEDYGTVTLYSTYTVDADSTGYWVLTDYAQDESNGNYLDLYNPEGTVEYVKSVIAAANAQGLTTLTFDVWDYDEDGDTSDDLIKTFTWCKDAVYWVTVDPEYISLEVTKVWDDDDDANGLRPDSITVELYANGEATGETLTLSEENSWSGSFDNLIKYDYGDYSVDTDDVEIVYTVVEVDVDGYTSTVTGSEEDGYVVTNTLIEIETPQTSDSSNIMLFAIIIGVAAVALVIMVVRKRTAEK